MITRYFFAAKSGEFNFLKKFVLTFSGGVYKAGIGNPLPMNALGGFLSFKNSVMWYYAVGKETKGPVDADALRELFRSGNIHPKTKIYGAGVHQWIDLEHSPLAYAVYGGGAAGHLRAERSAGSVRRRIFFMSRIIPMLSQGGLLQNILCWALRIISVLIAVIGLAGWAQNWRSVSQLASISILGGILFQLAFLAGLYMFVHVFFIRASHIKALPQSPFKLIPMFAIFLRAQGEAFAVTHMAFGIGGSAFLLLASEDRNSGRYFSLGFDFSFLNILSHVADETSGNSFVAALIYLAVSIALAIIVLLFFYLLAEASLLLVDIALNLRALREEKSEGTAAQSPLDY